MANEDPEQFGSDLNIGVGLFVPLSASINYLFSEKSAFQAKYEYNVWVHVST